MIESVHNSGDHMRKSVEGNTQIMLEGVPHTIFYRALNHGSHLPQAWQISVHSMAQALEQKADLRRQVLAFGAVAMAVALLLSLLISHGLTGPIQQLVRATNEIREGNFTVHVPVRSRDEIGNLTESFNGMAAGLLLKEKYRRVLDLVADKGIADELINGSIELGGEERIVSVLFCDIRGFTALTENMAPPEVVQMLNEHFEPLTRVVYEHNGVVDKYVGDLIMAIFGAPKDFGNNAEKAVRCALAMIRERQGLNRISKYPIAVGIGVASGKVLAGMMGAEDRRGYTVLGPKVNLASRLCSQAAKMEVIVDEETFAVARGWVSATALEPLKLKGFCTPIPAYKVHELRMKKENEMAQV
jgi:class 3 adenylate cyclase/HAMP domain-containing protein